MTDREICQMYRRVKREPEEGTVSAAIVVHAQACGLIAYVLGMHPDAVARVVRDHYPSKPLWGPDHPAYDEMGQ